MNREKKRKSDAPAPATSAGLLTFYGESTDSLIKIKPEIVMLMAVTLIVGVVLATMFITL